MNTTKEVWSRTKLDINWQINTVKVLNLTQYKGQACLAFLPHKYSSCSVCSAHDLSFVSWNLSRRFREQRWKSVLRERERNNKSSYQEAIHVWRRVSSCRFHFTLTRTHTHTHVSVFLNPSQTMVRCSGQTLCAHKHTVIKQAPADTQPSDWVQLLLCKALMDFEDSPCSDLTSFHWKWPVLFRKSRLL